MEPMVVGSVRADGPGRYEGGLPVGGMPDGSPIELPLVVVRGAKDGPVLWIHACVHGNEYCGTYNVHEFLRSLKPAEMTGTVVALPLVNYTGSQVRQRMSPFEGFNNTDMNRCFPGKADGGFTEQAAYHLFQALKAHATHHVDFHTAFTSDTRWALYAAPGGRISEVGRTMAEAFGYAHTLPVPVGTLTGSSIMSAAAEGIPSYIIEAGGIGDAFSRETVLDVAERLRNLARAIGVLPGKVTDYGKLTTFTNFHWCNASMGGLFTPAVKCGNPIREGDLVGTYYDLWGDERGRVTSPASGIVLAIHRGPLMPQGDTLIHIGLNPTTA